MGVLFPGKPRIAGEVIASFASTCLYDTKGQCCRRFDCYLYHYQWYFGFIKHLQLFFNYTGMTDREDQKRYLSTSVPVWNFAFNERLALASYRYVSFFFLTSWIFFGYFSSEMSKCLCSPLLMLDVCSLIHI